MNINDQPKCFTNHMGVWLVEPLWFGGMVAAVQSGNVKEQQPETFSGVHPLETTNEKRTALISITGVMMKGHSKFGEGTSTVAAREQLRQAVADPNIDSILLRIDSPGGHSAGTLELADEVRRADKVKPVFVQVEDLCASASFWVASQARKIFSNPMGETGSIGTVAVVQDQSEAFEREGIKVHVISTGDFKGSFAPGSEVTEAQLENLQTRVNEINQFFLDAVRKGRGMSVKALAAVADGRTFLAAEAQKLGLIDGVQSIEETAQQLRKEVQQNKRQNRARTLRAQINAAQGSEQPTEAE